MSELGWVTSILFGAVLGLWTGGKIRRFLRGIAYPWIEKRVRRG